MGSPWVDEEVEYLLRWWRVLSGDGALNRRMLFIDEAAAEDFARYLLAGGSDIVLLEHWREDGLTDLSVVVQPVMN